MDEFTVAGTRVLHDRPSDAGDPVPGVVVIQEMFGVNDDLRDIAGRFVAQGYAVAVPDLYTGAAKPLCIARTVLDVFGRHSQQTSVRIEGVRTWLAAQPGVAADRIGVIGFCMGAGIAVMSAARGDFGAASVNYGDVPRDTSLLDDICPVVGSFGARDRRLRPSAERLERALTDLGVPHDVKVYEGAGHSFLNRSIPDLVRRVSSLGYRPEQAADAWERIFAFFGEHLQAA